MAGAPDERLEEEAELRADVRLLGGLLGDTLRGQEGEETLALVEGLRRAAIALRARPRDRADGDGERDRFAERIAALDLGALEQVARAFTRFFQLMNAAEEQHRIRVLRRRDRPGSAPDGSIGAACVELHREGATADEVRALLARLFVMPVLTAHPTEARRRTVIDHLAEVSTALDRLDDPRPGARERACIIDCLREALLALHTSEEARAVRPTPFDEVRAGLHVFERTLLAATPAIYRSLEDALAECWPGEPFTVGPFLRYGTWIGGDRDGNPAVTAEVTRTALSRHRWLALARHLEDADQLGRELSVSARRVRGGARHPELEASLDEDRSRLPEAAARARRYAAEPWREKLHYVRARLEAARLHADAGYPDAVAHLDDLRLIERSLEACGLGRLARGRVRDARRRAEVFGFHLATLDLRQHSAVHESAVAELLGRGGRPGYAALAEPERVALLGGLLDRAVLDGPRDRAGLSPSVRELLATLEVVGRARRDLGAEACRRYVVSFTGALSDLLEVLFLARVAGLGPDELRPVPLLEQLEDLARARAIAEGMLATAPVRASLGGELEVMVGYSDSNKQAGYVASQVALHRAQEELAHVADDHGFVLTVFHGRGGAVGRGGGPANRAIRAQPSRALRGRLRVTEQGETVATRYGRPEIARRDLEQMVHAVLVSSLPGRAAVDEAERAAARAELERAAAAARRAYEALLTDGKLVRYAIAATPIEIVSELPIASRPAVRGHLLAFEELRAIPWVFSWNQSRHGLPGWYGLGTALDALVAARGGEWVRRLYREWPFFRALVDNAQLALVRADIDVAARYARLAGPDGQELFAAIRAEHARTVDGIVALTGEPELLAAWPTIARTVARRNPYVDVLSHVQIELLRRLRAGEGAERERVREVLFVTVNGIAAGLQTAG